MAVPPRAPGTKRTAPTPRPTPATLPLTRAPACCPPGPAACVVPLPRLLLLARPASPFPSLLPPPSLHLLSTFLVAQHTPAFLLPTSLPAPGAPPTMARHAAPPLPGATRTACPAHPYRSPWRSTWTTRPS